MARPRMVLECQCNCFRPCIAGPAFEHRALALLTKHMSMSLTRVGGSHDGGVDLIGWWWISSAQKLRVLAQCKAEKRRVGPAYLRELEGVVYRHAASVPSAPSTPNGSPPSPPPVALLVSESAFTRNCLLAAYASPLPFLLVHLPPNASLTAGDNDDDGSSSSSHNGGDSAAGALGAIFGNPALVSARGLLGGHLEFRWERGSGDDHPGLWWRGRPLPSWTPDGEPQSDAAAVLDRR
ncbi:hypothetical protein F5148DRAFT_1297868 [Russula earlei]|uniref:Uncharacterized protein n=1 Tax=Russula earlei TaxID=71964 RepID=A0ACC0UJ66_9AGAM|nr:hypothetical protein F5148DRAFT_1297868 [Russula earlei]